MPLWFRVQMKTTTIPISKVHKKLMVKLNREIIGIGCNYFTKRNKHCIWLFIYWFGDNYSSNLFIFLAFYCSSTSLKNFCDEAGVEYQKLLWFLKVRWLAFLPAVERVLKLYQPLRSYFLSLENCLKLLFDFFNKEMGVLILFFVHNQINVLYNTVKKN